MAFTVFRKGFPAWQKNTARINLILSAEYAMKSNLPIKWVRPEPIPCYKPQKSGDCGPLENVDKSRLSPLFEGVSALDNADENVKKLFTLEYRPYKETVRVLRDEYCKKVRRHIYDDRSPEARVAKMTADIRDMQKFMENNPHDRRTKVRLKETIDKRKRLLKNLRAWDYKCYEYVLEKLDLLFKATPAPDVWRRIERKRSLRMLTNDYCENIIQTKLSQYKSDLQSQQEDFLLEKIKTLNWIIEQEKLYGVPPSVSEDDVKNVELRLDQLRERKEKSDVIVND